MLKVINPSLSRKVVEMLLADGLSLSQIAKEAGTSVVYLKKVQAGKSALLARHLDKLDDVHPELPFRIGAEMVKGEVRDLAKKGRKVVRKVTKKGEDVVESAGRTFRKGAWKLLNGMLGGDD